MAPDPATLATALLDADFWRSLVPAAMISEDAYAPPTTAVSPDLVENLRIEGYDGPFPLLGPAPLARLAAGIAAVRALGLPPAFVFAYDDAWTAFHAAHPAVAAGLGADFVQLPAIWAWHLDPGEEARGFLPHRDRGHLPPRPDGLPNYLTVWIALTEATTTNGCITVLPGNWDAGYGQKQPRAPGTAEFQSFRALPTPAGSFNVWNEYLLHWGGRAGRRASGPRLSIACEFIRPELVGSGNDLELPTRRGRRVVLVDRQRLPPFALRLAYIAFAIRRYRHMERLPAVVGDLAEHLYQGALERLYDSPWAMAFDAS
jgi:hypothetical protein